MKRTLLSLLIAGVFAGAGTSVIAQNVTAEDQAPAAAKQTAPAKEDVTGKAKSGDAYNAAATNAQAAFNEASIKCDTMQGSEKTTCVSAAETARTEAMAKADKMWKSENDTLDQLPGADQSGNQAESQDGMTAPETGTTGLNEDQEPDQKSSMQSIAPTSAQRGDTQ